MVQSRSTTCHSPVNNRITCSTHGSAGSLPYKDYRILSLSLECRTHKGRKSRLAAHRAALRAKFQTSTNTSHFDHQPHKSPNSRSPSARAIKMLFKKLLAVSAVLLPVAQGLAHVWSNPDQAALPRTNVATASVSLRILNHISQLTSCRKPFPEPSEVTTHALCCSAHESALKSLNAGDSRMTIRLRNAISDLGKL